MTDKMLLSKEEAELILFAMGFCQGEGQMSDKDVNLCVKILESFPEFEKSHGYLRTCD